MTKITTVDRARKDQGKCGRCGAPIETGAPYRHASPGFRGRKIVRCMASGCYFRASELTTSKMADVYAAQEGAHEALDALGDFTDLDDVTGVLADCADAARQVADEYTEAADAMGGAGEELTERAEIIESWCDTLESPTFEDPPEFEDGTDPDDVEDEWISWREAVLDEVRQMVDEFEG